MDSKLRQWVEEIGISSSPEGTMDRFARKLWGEFKEGNPRLRKAPAFYIEKIASLRRIRSPIYTSIKGSGALRASKDGFIVILQEAESRKRRNFSLAHEIGHTYFYDTSISRQEVFGREKTYASRPIERLCDIFAVHLLMPEDIMLSFRNDDFRMFETFERISDRMDVSVESIVRRVGELGLTEYNQRNRKMFATISKSTRKRDIELPIVPADFHLRYSISVEMDRIDKETIEGVLTAEPSAFSASVVPEREIEFRGNVKKYGIGRYQYELGLHELEYEPKDKPGGDSFL